jgi:hypothetical protein
LHPNEENSVDGAITGRASNNMLALNPKKKSKFIQGLKDFDQKYIKPCMIHKFDPLMQKKTKEFMEAFANHGD